MIQRRCDHNRARPPGTTRALRQDEIDRCPSCHGTGVKTYPNIEMPGQLSIFDALAAEREIQDVLTQAV